MGFFQPKTLSVVANPFHSFDHEGAANCACPCDPDEHTPDRRFVGVVARRVVKGKLCAQFATDTVKLPNTAYYRARIASGEILAADGATAEACGIETFVKPDELLESERVAMVQRFVAAYGQPPLVDTDPYADLPAEEAKAEAAEPEKAPAKKATPSAAQSVAPSEVK